MIRPAPILPSLLTLTGLLMLAAPSIAVPIEHGTVIVPTGAARSLSSVTSSRVTLGGEINFGDYAVDVDPDGSNNDGVMIASIAENNPDGRYPTASVFVDGPLERSWIGVYYPAANSTTNEWNSNVAFAFFSDEDFDWAIAGTGQTNSEAITAGNLRSSSSVVFGTNFFDNANGTYTFDLTPTDSAKSSQNGILLTNGGRNEGNFTLAKAETDGSFTIYNHDNGNDGTVYERDAVRCVYIPTNHGRDDIAALARIDGEGNAIIADNGVFTVTESTTAGIWFLSIPGQTPDTGTLILTPEGGETRNVDNLISYQWDSTNQHWEIHTRDINSNGDPSPTGFQDMLTEPVFSFVFVVNARVIHVDTDVATNGDGISWATAFDNLQDALEDARYGDEIWVAEGSYYPDEGINQSNNSRTSTFALASNISLYGGFSGSETARSQRDPESHVTTLSGDLDQDGNQADNAFHILTADGVDENTVVDGFTVTAGNADGFFIGQERGGGLYCLNNATLRIADCIFSNNNTSDNGGAIYNDASSPTFERCHFENNTSGLQAGAVLNATGSLATYIDCTFRGNTAIFGGAVLNNGGADSTFINCSFQDNQATNFGGALYNSNASPTLENCLAWDNVANGNSTTASASISNQSGATPTYSHTLLQNLNLTGTGTNNLDGTNPANAPLFLSITDLRLAPNSPVKNLGDDTANSNPTDAFGNTRIQDTAIDLGAYEIPFETDQPTASFALTSGNTTDDVTLTFSITFSEEVLNLDGSDLIIATNGSLAFTSFDLSGDGPSYTLTILGVSGEGEFDIALSGSNDIIDLAGNAPAAGQGISKVTRLSSSSPIHYVDASNTTPLFPYDTWGTAALTIQDALFVANTDDDILVAEGTYYPDEGMDQIADDRDSSFTLDRRIDLIGGYPAGGAGSADPETYPTLLSGDLDQDDNSGGSNAGNAYNVVTVNASNSLVEGFEITAGNANAASGTSSRGGGLVQNADVMSLADCYFYSNHAVEGGGASFRKGTVDRCRFENNTASGNGGGLFVYTSSPNLPFTEVTNSIFRGNHCGVDGGGAGVNFFITSSFTNCLFQGNQADGDGGALDTSYFGGVLTLTNNSFQGNRALGNFSAHSGIPGRGSTMTNCIVWDNQPNGFGETPGKSITFENNVAFKNNLIANSGGSASGNIPSVFDLGGNVDFDPLFVAPIDPTSTPSTAGDLRLQSTSLAIGVGDDAANTEPLDLDENPRIVPLAIDLGPYESNQLNTVTADPSPVYPGESISLPGWASDTTANNGGTGFTYQMIPVATVGNLSFTTAPTVSPDGTLDFDVAPGEGGFAHFNLIISDPNGIYDDSTAYPITIRIRGFRFRCDLTATGTNNGLTWNDAFNDLDDALASAISGDVIWVSEGTHIPATSFTTDQAIEVYGGFPHGGGDNTFVARNPDPATNATILSGDLDQDGDSTWPDTDNADHVVTISSGPESFTLDGFTIRRGYADGSESASRGGGINIAGGVEAQLANLILEFNQSVDDGGAIAFEAGGASVQSVLRDSILRNNEAGDRGGALSAAFSPGSNRLQIEGCEFVNNEAASFGGALNLDQPATLIDCLIENNQSASGGGISTWRTMDMERCEILSNTVTSEGGGIYFNNSGGEIVNTILAGNTAISGGGAYSFSSGVNTFINCVYSGNSANRGGGLYVTGQVPELFNVSIVGNQVTDTRGAGYYSQDLSSYGFAFIHNVLIWNNSADGVIGTKFGSFYWALGGAPSFNHSMIQGWTKSELDNATGISLDTNFEPFDPLFVATVDPANAPTTGGDLNLLRGSPVINSGDNTTNSESFDLAGNARTQGNIIDLGAYESAFVSFAAEYPLLDPTGDENSNGISNYVDYALGANPNAPHNLSVQASLVGDQLTFSFRNNAADVFTEFQKSDTLLPDSWSEMILGTDYTLSSESINGSTTTQTLDLLTTEPKLFFREVFSETAP